MTLQEQWRRKLTAKERARIRAAKSHEPDRHKLGGVEKRSEKPPVTKVRLSFLEREVGG